jgi:hypothetical protein
MKTNLTENTCYTETLEILPVAKHGHFLEIRSRLDNAKNPEDTHVKHHVMCSLENLQKLHTELGEYLKTQKQS